jgi:hypothetical protein
MAALDQRLGDVEMTEQTDPILAALREQVQLYRRLAKLAEIQHDHVQNDRTEMLLDTLARRQEVLTELARFEAIVGPVKKRWSAHLEALPPHARGESEQLMTQTRVLLEQITTSDRNDAIVLQQRKLNLGKQIGQAKNAGRMNRAVAASAYGKPAARMDFTR